MGFWNWITGSSDHYAGDEYVESIQKLKEADAELLDLHTRRDTLLDQGVNIHQDPHAKALTEQITHTRDEYQKHANKMSGWFSGDSRRTAEAASRYFSWERADEAVKAMEKRIEKIAEAGKDTEKLTKELDDLKEVRTKANRHLQEFAPGFDAHEVYKARGGRPVISKLTGGRINRIGVRGAALAAAAAYIGYKGIRGIFGSEPQVETVGGQPVVYGALPNAIPGQYAGPQGGWADYVNAQNQAENGAQLG